MLKNKGHPISHAGIYYLGIEHVVQKKKSVLTFFINKM